MSTTTLHDLVGLRPRTPKHLHNWLHHALEITVPRAPRIPGHAAPFDYLTHAFFEPDDPSTAPARDAVVWANRGGGKTYYAAVATALDLIFKPTIEVLTLAGSLEQASRMHAHLRRIFERPHLAHLLACEPTRRELRLRNGSTATIIAQSERAIRGARPQKLRCDEVELLDPELWQAAQLVTRSKQCGPVAAHAAIDAISTMHRPHGLMSQLIGEAHERTRTLFRWSLVDVLEHCPTERPCAPCALAPECASRAKDAGGHITIDDAIAMKSRTDHQTWQAEMLCQRPSTRDLVFPEFDRAVHVSAFDPPPDGVHLASMDPGLRNPTVILFACAAPDGSLFILDQRAKSEALLDAHVQDILDAPWPRPRWVAIDPAGRQRSAQTGLSAVAVLRRAGLAVRDRRIPMELGLRAVRARLKPAAGAPTLFIHERCQPLIRALESYRYRPDAPADAQPVKDGADHHADALRYLVASLDSTRPATARRYL